MFERLAKLMYRRRWYVIGGWLLVLVISLVFASQVGSVLGPGDFVVKGSESYKAQQLLGSQFHQDSQKVSLVIIRNRALTVSNVSFRQTVRRTARKIIQDKQLRAVFLDNPLKSKNHVLMSRDGHGLALLVSSGLSEQKLEGQIDHLRRLVRAPGFETHVAGTAAANHDFAVASQDDLKKGDVITVPILIVVLLLVFGSVVAAGLPVLLTMFSIPLSLAGVYLFAHVINTSIYATNVVEVLGLGISVDYSLFIVFRYREELAACGFDREKAIVRTMMTTGRAIFVSGITVAIGLAALLLSGVVFMQSLGLAGILVPVSALLVAMTLLPAVLSVLGAKVNRLRLVPSRFLNVGTRGAWHRLATGIMNRPWLFGGAALILLLLAAFPATGLAYSYGSVRNAPKDLDSIQGYLYMRGHFPASPDPTLVLVQARKGQSLLLPSQIKAIGVLERQLRHAGGVTRVIGAADFLPVHVSPEARAVRSIRGRYVSNGGRSALIIVVPTHGVGTRGSAHTVAAVRAVAGHLQRGVLKGDGVYVGGAEAGYVDWDNRVLSRFPYIVGLVLLLTWAFLFAAFRSVLLPVKAVLLNLLSVGSAYGLMQLVFQRGVGSSILDFQPESGIATWVPIFMFAFLFGLSMDYEVLLLSRVREFWLATRHNRESVAFGLEKTGRLITSAALIMVIAFSGFVIGHQIQFKEFGFGLMISIAVDATIIRAILVPSIMELMGDWNWWVPRLLRDWAGRGVSHETAAIAVESETGRSVTA